MEFEVGLSSAKIKLGYVDYEGIRSTTNSIRVDHLSVHNAGFIVENGISSKICKMFHMKSLDLANFGFLGHTESEPCLLKISIQDRPLAIQHETLDMAMGCLRLSDATGTGLLSLFVHAAGAPDNVKVRLRFQLREANREVLDINSSNLQIQKGTKYSYIEVKFNFPDALTKVAWKSPKLDFTVKLKFFATFNEEALNIISKSGRVVQRSFNLLQGLLFGDVCIEAGNQQQLRCHKDILTGSTDYFKAMFESGMQEETTGVIHMPEMSEESVRALLSYFYQNDILVPLNCCSTAYELLVAADKYGILLLYDVMADIFLHRSKDWCSVETALELYFFANHKKVEQNEHMSLGNGLREKALDVLRSKGRDVLDACPAFQQAVDGQPGKQLCMDLLLRRKRTLDGRSESETENDTDNESTSDNSTDGNNGNGDLEIDMQSVYFFMP